jgi:hypothetical protein
VTRTLPLALLLGVAVASGRCTAAPAPAAASDWQYPVKLGESREQVYDRLGLPTEKIPDAPTSSMIEFFPVSGASVEFDEFQKARVLHFPGEYHLDGWVVSDKPVAFGLHPRSTRQQFADTLGRPVLASSGPDTEILTWKRGDWAILGEFWVRDVQQDGETFKAGTLKRLEVSPAQ